MAWLRKASNTRSSAGPADLGEEGADTDYPAEKPEYKGGEFPEPVLVEYDPIKPAPYKFIRPKKFARQFGQFNREEIMKNYDLAKQLAMSELEQELTGLEKFAPAAAALKRQQTSIDNVFNQAQRTRQIESVMPEVPGALQEQGQRAGVYASGALPDTLQDRALELGMRSRSADISTAGGFGATSSVARKASDLLSAEQRVQLAQYGEQLLGQNAQLRAQLLLAPTEYSDAGSQIRVMPEVGAGRLTAQALGMFNEATILPVSTALSAKIQQKQFKANLIQRTNEFNAANELSASMSNAGIQNQFALDRFGYEVGYAGVVAGVDTANNNTALGLEQQQQYGQIFQDYAQQAQAAQQAGAISSGIGNIIPGVVQGISGLFTPSGGATGGGEIPGVVSGGAEGDIEFGTGGPTVGGETIVEPPDYTGDSGIDYGAATGPQEPDISVGGDIPPFDASYDYSTEGYSFRAATGVQFDPSFQQTGNGVLRNAGLSYSPLAMPGAVKAGSDFRGRSIYSNPLLLSGTDTLAGERTTQTLSGILAPLGALSPEDLARVNEVGTKSADPNFVQELDALSGQRDTKGFINATLKAYGDTTIEDLAKNPNKDAGALTYASYKIAQNWPIASPEQKGLILSSLGVSGVKVQNGKSLGQAVIPATQKPGTQPATVAHALDWFRRGINAYPLTQKWDKFNTLARITAGKTDPESVAQTASRFRMLGAGVSGAEVPNVTAESLQKGGWTPTPHLGVGAIVASRGASLPEGYTQIGQDNNNIIAAPQGTAYSARGAVLKSAVPAQRGTGGIPVSQELYNGIQWGVGALNIYNQWQRKPGMGAAVSTAQTVANAADRYNQQQGQSSNYGQFVGSAAQLYSAYEAAKRGNYVGAAGYGTAAAFNGMAAWANSQGNPALAAQYTQYAGYAQAGMNFYGAYQAWKQGDKAGAGILAAGGAAELAGYGGAGLIAGGAYTGYQAFGTGNIGQGAIGGSMMLAGTVMAVGGPAGWAIGGALMAASVLGSAMKTGTTNKEHIARNGFRTYLKDSGLAYDKEDGGSYVMLADGTEYSLGLEDDSGRHSVTNVSLLADDQKSGKDDRTGSNSLRAYDTDYTNDLDFTSAMVGQTLTRLMAGGTETVTDQMGSALGNAGIANIGYNQAMSKDNFDKMAANQRGFYAKAGIASKNDAYQLANAAYAEGRLDEFQHTQAVQSINMIYDENGYEQAQQLMGGRHTGINAAAAQAQAENKTPAPKAPANISGTEIAETIGAAGPGQNNTAVGAIPGQNLAPGTRPISPATVPWQEGLNPAWGPVVDAANAANGINAAKRPTPTPQTMPGYEDYGPMVPYGGRPSSGPGGGYFKNQKLKGTGLMLTKEEIQARNKSRYASEAVA